MVGLFKGRVGGKVTQRARELHHLQALGAFAGSEKTVGFPKVPMGIGMRLRRLPWKEDDR